MSKHNFWKCELCGKVFMAAGMGNHQKNCLRAQRHNVVFIQDIVQLERERFDATGTKSWRGGLLPLMEAA